MGRRIKRGGAPVQEERVRFRHTSILVSWPSVVDQESCGLAILGDRTLHTY